jgi:MIP family channel proteins
MNQLRSKMLAEFIGTFALVFAGCGLVMVAERFPGSVPSFIIPMVFGLVIASMIYAIGHVSGAHFNPAVTLGFVIGRHFPKKEILPYWASQFTGALFAIFLLSVLLPMGTSYGATIPNISLGQSVVWEAILSFFLMFVIISVATDTRAVGVMAGAAIGGTVVFCAYLGGPVTGASMNPARTLAPNLFQGELSSLWVYFVGPCLGTLSAALIYETIRCVDAKKGAKGCC